MIAREAIAGELAAALAARGAAVRFSRDEEPGSDDFYIPPINNADQLAKVVRPGRPGAVARAGAHRRLAPPTGRG